MIEKRCKHCNDASLHLMQHCSDSVMKIKSFKKLAEIVLYNFCQKTYFHSFKSLEVIAKN